MFSQPAATSEASASRRVSFLAKLGYGVGNIGYSVPYQLTASFFIFYATEILQIAPVVAGTIGALSIIWDAVMDPLAGALSDNTESKRFGRRHPYLLGGGLAIVALSWLLWTISPDATPTVRIVSVIVFLLFLKTALAFFFVPYLALGGELSRDYDKRSSIQGVRASFYLLGMILALSSPIIFFRPTPEFPLGQLNPAAWPPLAVALSVITAVAVILCFVTTLRLVPRLPQRSAAMRAQGLSAQSFWKDFRGATKNPELLKLILMIFILEAGFQFGISIGFHVNTYTFGLSGPQIGLLGLTVLGTSVLSQPFWVWFTKRFEKRTAIIVGLVIGLVGFVGGPWTHVWWKVFPLTGDHIVLTLGIFMFIAGIGNGALMSVPNSMLADAADLEELRTGKRDEGLCFGTYTFAYKAGVACSWLLAGGALSLMGFVAGASTQTEVVKFHLAMVPTYLLLVAGPLALYAISRYGITRAKSREIQAALAARGQSV